MNDRLIYFNGLDLDKGGLVGDGVYGKPPTPISQLLARSPNTGRPGFNLNGKDVIEGIDPNRLEQAGWGLVVHEREDAAVLDALAPLCEKRLEDAGGNFRKLVFHESDTSTTFRQRYQAARGDANPSKLPYYLLIVGEPSLIPFAFQTEMDTSYAVGRVAFRRPQDYAQYVANVLAHERGVRHRLHRLHFFATDNGDALTEMSVSRLAGPIRASLTQRSVQGPAGPWTIETTPPQEATRAHLLELFTSGQGPDILFTASHGVVCSESLQQRENCQGGLVCSDWQTNLPFSDQHCIFAQDLTPEMDFRGLMCFFFSCYTAGTPALGTNLPPSQVPVPHHPHPFVAHLPQAMLAHKRGALAVIGHVEECFQHSFLWHESIGETDHFSSSLARLMAGERIGRAMEHFRRRLADIAVGHLGRMHEPDPPSAEEMRLFWLTFQDARNYIILGDPAVRLQGAP